MMTDTKRTFDPFQARDSFDTGSGQAWLYRLTRLEDAGLTRIADLPFSIRVLLESVLRNCDGYEVTEARRQKPGRLEGRRAEPAIEDALQAGPGGAAGFHRRAAAWSIWRPCAAP